MVKNDENHSTGKNDIDPKVVRQLIDHGRKQGFLTQHDLFALLPDSEFDEDIQARAISTIEGAGIPIMDEETAVQIPAVDGESGPEIDPETLIGEEIENESLSPEDILSPEILAKENDLDNIDASDMLRLYVREASRTALLTSEEELELARRIERSRFDQEELAHKKISTKHKQELEKHVEEGKAARERLIRANARLVISIARKYIGRGLPFLDLIQEGNVGLMRAIRNFDYHRGFKFSTYATWWIRQAITRALAEQSRTIRLPVHVSEQISKMMREQNRLQQQLGRAPTPEELAEALGLPPERITQMEEMLLQPLSLQAPVGEDEEESLGNLIEDIDAPDPEEKTLELLANQDLRARLNTLPPREKQVLELRYGLTGGAPMTLSEVGQQLGITRERARQLESQALKRLRKPTQKY